MDFDPLRRTLSLRSRAARLRDGAIWSSNGPIYTHEGFNLAMRLLTATCATAYLICKIARPDLQVPETSKFIFGNDVRSAGPIVRESALAIGLINAFQS